jgi:hypothetical protein
MKKMGRTALYEEGLAKGRYVRLPNSIDDIVMEMSREEERELGAVLRRLVKAGLRAEGRLPEDGESHVKQVKKRAAA